MPPQQSDRLLHVVDERRDFSAHDFCSFQELRWLGSIEAAALPRQPEIGGSRGLGRAGALRGRHEDDARVLVLGGGRDRLLTDDLGGVRRLVTRLEGLEDDAVIAEDGAPSS
jgi:hypothetical protein